MQFRVAVPDKVLDERTINAVLEATTRANEALAARGMLPDIGDAIRKGLRWKPEPWVGEEFALAPVCAARGWMDCDDAAPWLAAQLRAKGMGARAFVKRTGPHRYHAVVEDEHGREHDPSAWAGMPTRRGKVDGYELAKPVRRLVTSGQSAVCAVPHGRSWQDARWYARADMPLSETVHMVGWSVDRDPSRALGEALGGYGILGEALHGAGVGGDESAATGLADVVAAGGELLGLAVGTPCENGVDCGPLAKGLREAREPERTPGKGEAGEPPKAAPERNVERIHAPPPHGFPPTAVSYSVPGPGGFGRGRVTFVPGGGPVYLEF